jgi:hypothetical protein
MEPYFSPSLLGALPEKSRSFATLEDSLDSSRAIVVARRQGFGCPGQRRQDCILPITASACRAALQLELVTYCCYVFVIRLPPRVSYTSISTHLSGLLDSDVQDFNTMQAKLPTIAPWSH